MKKIICGLALNVILAGTFLTSCETKQQKVEDAKQDLKDARQDARQEELNAEYPAYKKEMEERIEGNNRRIADIRADLAKPGNHPFAEERKKNIDNLEKRNAEMRSRLEAYEKDHSDWSTFKRNFNHDMDNLGDAFRDFGNDLKK